MSLPHPLTHRERTPIGEWVETVDISDYLRLCRDRIHPIKPLPMQFQTTPTQSCVQRCQNDLKPWAGKKWLLTMLLTFFNISHHSSFLIPVSPLLLVWEATKQRGKKSSKIIKSWFYNDNYLLLLLFTVFLNSTKAHGL